MCGWDGKKPICGRRELSVLALFSVRRIYELGCIFAWNLQWSIAQLSYEVLSFTLHSKVWAKPNLSNHSKTFPMLSLTLSLFHLSDVASFSDQSLKNSGCESIVQWTRNEEEAVVGEHWMRISLDEYLSKLVLHHTSSALWRRKQNVLRDARRFTSSFAARFTIFCSPFAWTFIWTTSTPWQLATKA